MTSIFPKDEHKTHKKEMFSSPHHASHRPSECSTFFIISNRNPSELKWQETGRELGHQ